MKFTVNHLFFRRVERHLKALCLGMLVSVLFVLSPVSMAQNINTVTQEVLQNIKGVGANKAQKIITERQRGGNFLNAQDLRKRVKGVGEKTLQRMEKAGITFVSEPVPSPVIEGTTDAPKPEKRIRSRSRPQ